MRALTIDGIESCLMTDVPEPVAGPDEVLVAVRHVGLCGSDLATFSGSNPLVSLPRIPGHEIGGVIIGAGHLVAPEYRPGRRVIVLPYTTCGTCTSCRSGRVNACRYNRTLGVQQDGGLAERIVLGADKLILNDTLPDRHLPLVEPLSVGFHAVGRGRISARDHVAVIGCGMIGLGVVLAAVEAGARVTAIDVSATKRALASDFGAAGTIDAADPDASGLVQRLTDDRGFDAVFEAVGSPDTFTRAIDYACYSGRVVYIGYSKEPVTYDTKHFNLKELDIAGSRNATAENFQAAIACLERLGERADRLVTRVFAFGDAALALPHWQANRSDTLKILIENRG